MIPVIYKSTYGSYSSDEWKDRIISSLNKIKSTYLGNILINKIEEYNSHAEINVSIVSEETYKNSIKYPKITYYHGKSDIQLVIPEMEYISKIRVIDTNIIPKSYITDDSNIPIQYFACISNNNEVPKSVLISDDVKNKTNKFKQLYDNITYTMEQPLEIIIAHEMIHCLRLLTDNHLDYYEEEATIFGMTGNTLYVDGHKITENTIRLEMMLPMRVNHDT